MEKQCFLVDLAYAFLVNTVGTLRPKKIYTTQIIVQWWLPSFLLTVIGNVRPREYMMDSFSSTVKTDMFLLLSNPLVILLTISDL